MCACADTQFNQKSLKWKKTKQIRTKMSQKARKLEKGWDLVQNLAPYKVLPAKTSTTTEIN